VGDVSLPYDGYVRFLLRQRREIEQREVYPLLAKKDPLKSTAL
jgi:hypothetical protein